MIVLYFLRTLVGYPAILVVMTACASLIWLGGQSEFSESVLRVWARFVLLVVGARVVTKQLAPLDPAKNYVFVSNHTSDIDVPAIILTTPSPLRFIAKRELTRLPLFGPAARRMGHVFIDRSNSQGSAKRIRERIERGFGRGVALFFFAEGTRSRSDALLPFKKGAAVAALDMQLDVVPVAVAGAREILPRGMALARPGIVAVVYGAPIAISGFSYDTRDALVAAQRAAVEEALREAKSLRATLEAASRTEAR